MIARRRFLISAAASLLAAPSIVRAASLMAIKVPKDDRIPANLGGARYWYLNGYDAHGFEVHEVIADFSADDMVVRWRYPTPDEARELYATAGA